MAQEANSINPTVRCMSLLPLLWGLTAVASGEKAPNEIVRSAVDVIEHHYLYADTNSAWPIARDHLLHGDYRNSAEAYLALIRELNRLGDSELNLISTAELTELQKDTTGQRIGVGLVEFAIDRNPGGEARIVTPIFGTPAAEAGVHSGDILEAVNDKPTKTMTHEEIIDELRRQVAGHTVLDLRRGTTPIRVALNPIETKLIPVQVEIKTDEGIRIGYIRILEFTPEAGHQVRLAVSTLESDSVAAYILDLRNNPGGLLSSAVAAASAFTSGTLGFVVHQNGKRQPIESSEGSLTKKALIVLINDGTASAAEVLTAALKDQARATIVGMRSYGRGQAQMYYPLGTAYGIIVPSAVMQSPSRNTFKGTGLIPDIEVPSNSLRIATAATKEDSIFARALTILENNCPPSGAACAVDRAAN